MQTSGASAVEGVRVAMSLSFEISESWARSSRSPCAGLASFKSAGRGGVGGDDGSSALWD